MKKIDLRTKKGRALKAKRDAAITAADAAAWEWENPPTVGGVGVRGVYAPMKLDADPVISPSHYTQGGIETIDFIRAKLSKEEFKGYCKGNAVKYLSRAELKGGAEDYKKAQVYLGWLIEQGE